MSFGRSVSFECVCSIGMLLKNIKFVFDIIITFCDIDLEFIFNKHKREKKKMSFITYGMYAITDDWVKL